MNGFDDEHEETENRDGLELENDFPDELEHEDFYESTSHMEEPDFEDEPEEEEDDEEDEIEEDLSKPLQFSLD